MGEDRVLVVTHFFPPEELGGAHRWQRIISHLPEGNDARVLCPPPAYPFGEFDASFAPVRRESIDGIPVTRLWTYQPSSDSRAEDSNLGRLLNYAVFSAFATLYTLVFGWRYDTIVTVSTPHTTFLPGIVGRFLGLEWVVDVFDLWLDNAVSMGYVERGALRHDVVAWLEREAITRSDQVLVVTGTMGTHFERKYDVSSDRFTVVPFGVDRTLFRSRYERDVDIDPDRIVYIGNLGDSHALVPFLRALVVLEEHRLVIVGTGKRQAELEAVCSELGITDRVSFEGVRPRADIPEALSKSAVSIVPLQNDKTLDYACPNKLLESMAVGTPFVASNIREIERVAEESGAGVAVPNDPAAIADAVRTVTADEARRDRMGRAGVAYIDANHQWSAISRRVSEALGTNSGSGSDV